MFPRGVISPGTLDLLRQLQSEPSCREFCLAGGTALALQLGHRFSEDLDLFSDSAFDPTVLLATIRRHHHAVSVEKLAPGTLLARVDDVKVDLLEYRYPRLAPTKIVDSIRMFDLSDIAAMKLSAVTNRGARKDFIDIAFLIQKFGLPALLGWYRDKFAGFSLFPVIKSLAYFDDAEDDPAPLMLLPMTWDAVKQVVTKAVAEMGES